MFISSVHVSLPTLERFGGSEENCSNKVWSETKSLKGYTNSVSQKILQGGIIKIHNNHMGQREQSHNRRHWPRKDIY